MIKIPHEIHNPRYSSEANKSERNDCTVRAIANAFDIDYDEAHEALEIAGRKYGKGFSLLRFFFKNKFFKGYHVKRLDLYDLVWERGPKMTIRRFLSEYKFGVYIATLNNHVFVVKDGVIHDSFRNSSSRWIQTAYRVYKS